ncbi:MAG TPA: glycosyltransferase, partial [Candidatus Dormibacteraeota bacterium]|nr:glycosyltransferase [Candidatus Dormibacteraeota bacterium]
AASSSEPVDAAQPGRNGAAPAARPRVAVVIPTRDRPALLRRCLDALAAQTLPAAEVVVVDDGSTPPVPAVPGPGAAGVRVVRLEPGRGPAAARNAGWRAASAEIVAFTDDDCRPDPGWLAALAGRSRPGTVLMGRTLPDPLDGPESAVTDRTIRITGWSGMFLTCNVLYPRALLEELGGFDEAFPLPYGEDSDLGQRALKAGAAAEFVDEALVHHAVHRLGVRALLRERTRITELMRVTRRHPELRHQDLAGLFVTRDHRVFLEALTGLALLPVCPGGVALVERYLHECRCRVGHMPPHRRARDIAGRAALDAYEVALCAVGSVRHRTLLL